jgi:hypothetical protein
MPDTTLTTTPTEVCYIANHWHYLQPHVREAIMTLVDGALTSAYGQTQDGKERCADRGSQVSTKYSSAVERE